MEKPAETRHPVHELIERRWSPVTFAERSVPAEAVCCLLEAARWAPSSFNEQPWSFFVARREEPEAFERLLETLVPANQAWARHAPLLLLSVAKTTFERNAVLSPADAATAYGSVLSIVRFEQGRASEMRALFEAALDEQPQLAYIWRAAQMRTAAVEGEPRRSPLHPQRVGRGRLRGAVPGHGADLHRHVAGRGVRPPRRRRARPTGRSRLACRPTRWRRETARPSRSRPARPMRRRAAG